MAPLRKKLGVPEAPAMPVIHLDLPVDCLNTDDEPAEISPHERFKLFHKLYKRHLKEKIAGSKSESSTKPAGKQPEARNNNSKGHAMSVLEDTSAILASHADLIDIDDFNAKYGRTKEVLDDHNDHIADTSQMSSEYFASVHTPVDNWRQIEDARKALHEEREKLEKKNSWDLSKPRYRSETEDEARRLGVDYHYGKLLLLCHIKGSQLCVSRQTYKGRIVY